MDNIAIKVENVSKIYKLYEHPLDRLKEALNPFGKKYHHEYYSLDNISFEIKKGETVGIIGRNGAGKSTLLKIITGVLTPTNGQVHIHGRIASLLELGAGFNPEMTGLENIFFSGTIMGFTHAEMKRKLEDILAFADIGEFIHQPVKTYSSGMYVRLAFAINVAIEPEILIIDEALAVGDALFQKRCYQHMEKLVSNGTTLLFVSHEQESIRTLTNRAILLNHGKIDIIGTSAEVILEYRKQLHAEEEAYHKTLTPEEDESSQRVILNDNKLFLEPKSYGFGGAKILSVKTLDENKEIKNHFNVGDKILIEVTCITYENISNLGIALRIRNKEGIKIITWGTINEDMQKDTDVFWEKTFAQDEKFKILFSTTCILAANFYEIQCTIAQEGDLYYNNQKILHWIDEACFFSVSLKPREYIFDGICDIGLRSISVESFKK